MEMMEVIRTWKKFGKPQLLVNQNKKRTLFHQDVDLLNEAMGLFSGWLRHFSSQQLVLISILSGSILLLYEVPTLTQSDNIVWMFLTGLPSLTTVIIALYPIFTALQLFPFKWNCFSVAKRKVINQNLSGINIILLLVLLISPYASLTSISGTLATLTIFGFYLGIGYYTESIRFGLKGGKVG